MSHFSISIIFLIISKFQFFDIDKLPIISEMPIYRLPIIFHRYLVLIIEPQPPPPPLSATTAPSHLKSFQSVALAKVGLWMVMADTSREFQEENEITKFGDNIGVGQFFLYKQRLKCWKVHQNWWKFVWIANIFFNFSTKKFYKNVTKIGENRMDSPEFAHIL